MSVDINLRFIIDPLKSGPRELYYIIWGKKSFKATSLPYPSLLKSSFQFWIVHHAWDRQLGLD